MNEAGLRLARALGVMGRTRRTPIILFVLASLLFHFVLLILGVETSRGRGLGEGGLVLLAHALPWIRWGAQLLFLWLAVRRFHDQDRPGWLAVIPFGALIVAGLLPGEVGFAMMILVLIGYVVALLLPPTVGPNRYGPDPRGWRSPEHYAEERSRGRAT